VHGAQGALALQLQQGGALAGDVLREGAGGTNLALLVLVLVLVLVCVQCCVACWVGLCCVVLCVGLGCNDHKRERVLIIE